VITMAKLNEDMVVIKVSELLKDSDDNRKILNHEIVSTIEAAVQELVGAGKLVEIIQEDTHV
jgi:uncharacterized protein YccT (UPF0319 family)